MRDLDLWINDLKIISFFLIFAETGIILTILITNQINAIMPLIIFCFIEFILFFCWFIVCTMSYISGDKRV
jgi:hypothetical protein